MRPAPAGLARETVFCFHPLPFSGARPPWSGYAGQAIGSHRLPCCALTKLSPFAPGSSTPYRLALIKRSAAEIFSSSGLQKRFAFFYLLSSLAASADAQARFILLLLIMHVLLAGIARHIAEQRQMFSTSCSVSSANSAN